MSVRQEGQPSPATASYSSPVAGDSPPGRLNFFIIFFAYDFGGGESRPSDLQAWIIEGGTPEERGRDWEVISASRMSNFHLSRQGKNFFFLNPV